jgi:hypothetical protein
MVVRRGGVNICAWDLTRCQLEGIGDFWTGCTRRAGARHARWVSRGLRQAAMRVPVIIGTGEWWGRRDAPVSFGAISIIVECAAELGMMNVDGIIAIDGDAVSFLQGLR